jgi:hypothetical protein
MFQMKYVEKKSNKVFCSITFFSKIVPFLKVEKYGRAGHATDNSMAHAHCALYC